MSVFVKVAGLDGGNNCNRTTVARPQNAVSVCLRLKLDSVSDPKCTTKVFF